MCKHCLKSSRLILEKIFDTVKFSNDELFTDNSSFEELSTDNSFTYKLSIEEAISNLEDRDILFYKNKSPLNRVVKKPFRDLVGASNQMRFVISICERIKKVKDWDIGLDTSPKSLSEYINYRFPNKEHVFISVCALSDAQDLSLVEYFIKEGADINYVDKKDHLSPLCASFLQRNDVVSYYLISQMTTDNVFQRIRSDSQNYLMFLIANENCSFEKIYDNLTFTFLKKINELIPNVKDKIEDAMCYLQNICSYIVYTLRNENRIEHALKPNSGSSVLKEMFTSYFLVYKYLNEKISDVQSLYTNSPRDSLFEDDLFIKLKCPVKYLMDRRTGCDFFRLRDIIERCLKSRVSIKNKFLLMKLIIEQIKTYASSYDPYQFTFDVSNLFVPKKNWHVAIGVETPSVIFFEENSSIKKGDTLDENTVTTKEDVIDMVKLLSGSIYTFTPNEVCLNESCIFDQNSLINYIFDFRIDYHDNEFVDSLDMFNNQNKMITRNSEDIASILYMRKHVSTILLCLYQNKKDKWLNLF